MAGRQCRGSRPRDGMGGVRHPLKQGPRAAVKSTCSRHTVASISTNMSDRHVIDLRWSATGDGRKRRAPSPATPTVGSPHARYPPGLGSGSRTPTGRGNTTRPPTTSRPATKSSLRVSGGFRQFFFRPFADMPEFQSALRFAVVSDPHRVHRYP